MRQNRIIEFDSHGCCDVIKCTLSSTEFKILVSTLYSYDQEDFLVTT